MEKVKRLKRSELVTAGIRQLIVDEGLKPGDRLPTEQEMADRFGVSRVSVREATKALSFLGIIRAAPRRGLTLGEVDMSQVTQYLKFHFALTDYPRTQLMQTRLVIESGALPYIARAMAQDGEVFDRLASMVEASRQRDNAQWRVTSDVAFHRALLESSGVDPLLVFDDLLQIFFDRFFQRPQVLPTDDPWNRVVNEHERLIRHLRDGEVEAAHRMLAEHLGHYAIHLDK
jgi:GntR family transcriptional regulator, transcriptional repressor for pyruvate dehydrogenase complex